MDLILNPLQLFKVSFWSALPKTRLFLFYKTGELSLCVSEWASQARAAVRWDYGTTVGKGSATCGRGEWPDLRTMTSRWTAGPGSLTGDTVHTLSG